jgi:predicted MFS family arabinose efflux permease
MRTNRSDARLIVEASKVEPPGVVRSGTYRSLLRRSVVRRQAASGLLAQVTQGAASVAIILVIRAETRSLALAGAIVSAVWIAGGIARPLQGRVIDRGGARRLLAVCGVAHAAALAGIVGVSRLQGLGWLLIVLGVLAGIALPPISTSMRTAWPVLVSPDERTACYSLVYLVQELAILAGPLLLAALTAAFSASVALIAIAVLAGCGTLAFAATTGVATSGSSGASTVSGSPLRARGLPVLLVIALLVGGVLGALQVAAAALAAAHHAPAAAGLLIAAFSVGGIVGAAIYGARRWRARAWRRLVLLLVLLTTPLALMTTTQSLIVVAGLVLLAGVTLNPALSTFSLLLDQHIAGGAVAEAFGWLSTAIAAGTGGGSALTAVIAQHQQNPRAAFAAAAIASAAAAALTLSTRPMLDRTAAERT